MLGQSQIFDLLDENFNIITGLFSVELPSSGTIRQADGDLTRLIKGQTTRVTDWLETVEDTIVGVSINIRDLKDLFNARPAGYTLGEVYQDDGPITRLIKGQTSRIVDSLDDFRSQLFNNLKVNSRGYTIGEVYQDDGPITRLIKGQTSRIVDSLESALDLSPLISKFEVNRSGYTIGEFYSNDGDFTKLLKGQTTRTIDSLDDFRSQLLNNLKVNSRGYTIGDVYQDDGPITRLIKGQTSRIVDSLDDFRSQLFNNLKVDSRGYTIGDVYQDDGPITRLIKGQTSRIIESLSNLSIGENETDYTPITSILKNIEKALDNLTITNEGGTIWDFLSSLIEGLSNSLLGILDFIENLLDFLIEIIVPSDTEFITTFFTNTSNKISEKFNFVTDVQIMLTETFNVEQKEFTDDFYLTFDKYGEVKVFDTSTINHFLPIIRTMLSGFIVILTTFWAYRKITGTGGVIE